MNAVLLWVLETTISASALALFALIACRFFRRRPAIQHLLWLIVLCRFLLPPVVAWPTSARNLVSDWVHSVGMSPRSTPNLSAVGVLSTSTIEPADSAAVGPADDVRQDSGSWWRTASMVILLSWGIGLSIVVLRNLQQVQKWRSMLATASGAPDHLLQEIQHLANALVMRPIPVRVAERIASPFLWCFGLPRLIWPVSLSSEADVRRSRSILAHELGHVRRCDHFVAWIELAAGLIWWWNPVFWFVRHRVRESAEMACDALAISALPDERVMYAELFLEFSSKSNSGVPVPVLGVSTGTRSSFERRLTMILSEGVTGRLSPMGIGTAFVLVGLALPSLLLGEQKEFENTGPSGNVIYLVDDDGDGIADRPAISVESESIDGDEGLGKIYFVTDTDPESQKKIRKKVTIINSRKIENGIVIHTLGRLKVPATAKANPDAQAEKPKALPRTKEGVVSAIKEMQRMKSEEAAVNQQIERLRADLDRLVEQSEFQRGKAEKEELESAVKKRDYRDEILQKYKSLQDERLQDESHQIRKAKSEVERAEQLRDEVLKARRDKEREADEKEREVLKKFPVKSRPSVDKRERDEVLIEREDKTRPLKQELGLEVTRKVQKDPNSDKAKSDMLKKFLVAGDSLNLVIVLEPDSRHLIASDSKSGQVLWKYALGDMEITSVSVVDKAVQVILASGKVIQVDTKTGARLDQLPKSKRDEVEALEQRLKKLRAELQEQDGPPKE